MQVFGMEVKYGYFCLSQLGRHVEQVKLHLSDAHGLKRAVQ